MAFMGQLVQWEDQLKGTIKPSKQLSDKENNAIKDIVHLTQQIKSWLAYNAIFDESCHEWQLGSWKVFFKLE